MTLKEIAYDILKTLTKHKITDDTRVNIPWLEYKINQYRSIGIAKSYEQSGLINPAWKQPFSKVVVTKVNAADDEDVVGCNCVLGKIAIPTVVGLPNHLAISKIISSCKTKSYYPIAPDRFEELVQTSIRAKFNYFFQIGNAVFIHPYTPELSMRLILDDPREGYIMKNQYVPSGSLVVGSSYKIMSGRITHNSIAYQKNQTFTAVSKVFTGAGLVRLEDPKVMLTDDDQYPIDHTMTEFIVMKILTQDFGIEQRVIADGKNDSQDEAIRKQM